MFNHDPFAWFPCFPKKWLAALGRLRHAEKLIFIVTCFRIYDARAPIPEDASAIALECDCQETVVKAALDRLVALGLMERKKRMLDNAFARKVLGWQDDMRENKQKAGRMGAERRWKSAPRIGQDGAAENGRGMGLPFSAIGKKWVPPTEEEKEEEKEKDSEKKNFCERDPGKGKKRASGPLAVELTFAENDIVESDAPRAFRSEDSSVYFSASEIEAMRRDHPSIPDMRAAIRKRMRAAVSDPAMRSDERRRYILNSIAKEDRERAAKLVEIQQQAAERAEKAERQAEQATLAKPVRGLRP